MRATLLVLVGCGGSAGGTSPTDTGPPATDTDTDEPIPTTTGGQCGDTTRWDVEVRGRVVDAYGAPAVGADVRLEERAYSMQDEVYGSGPTDGTGGFTFSASQVVSVEDCWATLLDYVVVAESGDLRAERDANSELFSAIDGGSLVADLSAFPLVLEEP